MKTKVLFLSAWYPNRYDSMAGLFVKRHAECMAAGMDVAALYACASADVDTYEVESVVIDNVKTIIVYYPKINSPVPVFGVALKIVRYLKAYIKGIKVLKRDVGLPNIVHLNILTRTGIVALYFKFRYNIPFVITEHWSRYSNLRNEYKGFWRKLVTNFIVVNCEAISTVSECLRSSMISCGINHDNFLIVSNLVDFDLFKAQASFLNNRIVFSHITCFDDQAKNEMGIIRTIKALSEMRTDFCCLMIGDGPDKVKAENLAKELNINSDILVFTGLKEMAELVKLINQSAFTLLFSNYENMPVVLSESLACGKPVVATKVGGIPEIIDSTNGILVDARNEQQLFEAINKMMNTFQNYNSEEIIKRAQSRFSSEAVYVQLSNLYSFALSKDK